MNAAPTRTPRMTRVVVLPIPNSPLVSGSTFHLQAAGSGFVHAPVITAAAETITAGKSCDLTARQGRARFAYRRRLPVSAALTVFG